MTAVAAAMLGLGAAQAGAQQPVGASPQAVDSDGGGSPILRPAGLGLAMARDGTGGLIYLKSVNGSAHVFVSRLLDGSVRPPVQVDPGLAGSSSQPVIAAGNAGLLLVAFVNSGELYLAHTDRAGRFGSPQLVAGGAINPAISATSYDSSYDSGKGYLAFALPDGSGYDIRTLYYYEGKWSVEPAPLNLTPGDDAGTGSGRPAIAAAGDGTAVVVWGENGHIYSQQVWGTEPYSATPEQADTTNSSPSPAWPPSGCSEVSADEPAVSAGGDSSYVPVAFREHLNCAGQQQTRVVMDRLDGGLYDWVTPVDGLSAGSGTSATDPQVGVTDYEEGWATAAITGTNDLFARPLGANAWPGASVSQVNSLANSAPPQQVVASAGVASASLIAWQQEPGSMGNGDIRLRYEDAPAILGPETVVSSPAQGPTDAADGLAAAGDRSGDAAIAWLQGNPGATEVMVEELYQPPGRVAVAHGFAYSSSAHPVLSWSRPSGWGPMTYSLSVSGSSSVRTSSTSLEFPSALSDGPHRWQVVAINPVGQRSSAQAATVFVDTVPPRAKIRLFGRRVAGQTLGARVSYADRSPAGDASGIAAVVVRWGDGRVAHLGRGTHVVGHVYRRPGRYRVTLIVADRAGNVTKVTKVVRVRRSGK